MIQKSIVVLVAIGIAGMTAAGGWVANHNYHKTSPIALADVPTPMVKPNPKFVRKPVDFLEVNTDAIQLIMDNEGLRLEPYKFDGKWYVGYGHGRTAKADMRITEEDAITLLRDDLRRYEEDVRRLVDVPLTEGQFSALVSFVYNCGEGTFARSSIRRYINNGEFEKAADALMLYTKARVNGEHRELASLKRRRAGERALFLGRQTVFASLRT